jgi:hypothetical protein
MNNQSRHEKLLERYRRIVSDRRAHADQPLLVFCRSHKINVWSYYYWKKKIECDSAPFFPPIVQQQPFIPLSISIQETQPTGFEIYFGNDTRLSVQPRFNKDELTTIIDLLFAKAS